MGRFIMGNVLKKGIILLLGISFIGIFVCGVLYFEENKESNNKANKNNINQNAIYKNVMLLKGEESTLKCIIDNKIVCFKTISKLENKYNNVICDIEVKNEKVYKIRIKPYKISGKLMIVDNGVNKNIEVENYGKIGLTPKYRVYSQKKDNYKEVSLNDLIIGNIDLDYVLEEDKICAIILKNKEYNGKNINKNIRVLLKDSNYKSIYHNNVTLYSKGQLEMLYADNVKQASSTIKVEENSNSDIKSINYNSKIINPNKKITIKPNSQLFSIHNRIIIRSKDNKKGIYISTIKRASSNINYSGQIELLKTKYGIIIINDVEIEKYLYSVVPSEMPESYGVEALKVQAICARTYAYSQLNNDKYEKYGANIDDSISYQVYNNQNYGVNSIKAVDETKGVILKYKNDIAKTFYYSTSCGYSSNTKDVFGGENIEYLPSKKQNIINYKVNKDNKLKDKQSSILNEKAFKKFILSTGEDCFEKNCEWFRWKIKWNVNKISKAINNNLSDLCKNGKNSNIYVYNRKTKKYISKPIKNIGSVKNIKISKRASGGVVIQIIIQGTKGNIKVCTQYTIRKILGPYNANIIKNNYIQKSKSNINKDKKLLDNYIVKNMEMLPSSYFIVENKGKEYIITGGGFGHGVGMSQCGVNELAKRGLKYNEIIEYYYDNVKLEYY